MPPPEPRSSTVSPSFNSAKAVGLPHPREAFTAVSGREDFCLSSYRSRVMGSISAPQHVGAQQDAAMPELARRAASPYLPLITSFTASTLIPPHIRLNEYEKATPAKHICQGECIMAVCLLKKRRACLWRTCSAP